MLIESGKTLLSYSLTMKDSLVRSLRMPTTIPPLASHEAFSEEGRRSRITPSRHLTGCVRERRWSLAANDSGCFLDEFVVRQRFYHEESKVYAARDIAPEYGIADMPAPHGQTLALAFFQVASSNDCPAFVAGKHSPACLDLIIDV